MLALERTGGRAFAVQLVGKFHRAIGANSNPLTNQVSCRKGEGQGAVLALERTRKKERRWGDVGAVIQCPAAGLRVTRAVALSPRLVAIACLWPGLCRLLVVCLTTLVDLDTGI